MIIWGGSFVWTKIVLNYYEPITTVFLRLVISSTLLFAGLKISGKLQVIERKDYKLFVFSALLNPFLYFLGENYGVKLSTPTISAVIIATIPLFTPIMGYIIFREKLSLLNVLGLLVSFLGVLLMLIDRDFNLTTSPAGVAWLILAVITAVFYAVLLKKLALRYEPFNIIAVQNLLGAIFFLPLFLWLEWKHFIEVIPNRELLVSLFMLAIFASSLAFVFFTIGARELGISRTSLFSNLIPVFTALFSFFLLHEVFDSRKIFAMFLVLTGVFLSQTGKIASYKSTTS